MMDLLESIALELANEIKQGKWPDDQHDFNNDEVLTELHQRINGYQKSDYIAASRTVSLARAYR